jgi:hypothetical protein
MPTATNLAAATTKLITIKRLDITLLDLDHIVVTDHHTIPETRLRNIILVVLLINRII